MPQLIKHCFDKHINCWIPYVYIMSDVRSCRYGICSHHWGNVILKYASSLFNRLNFPTTQIKSWLVILWDNDRIQVYKNIDKLQPRKQWVITFYAMSYRISIVCFKHSVWSDWLAWNKTEICLKHIWNLTLSINDGIW